MTTLPPALFFVVKFLNALDAVESAILERKRLSEKDRTALGLIKFARREGRKVLKSESKSEPKEQEVEPATT